MITRVIYDDKDVKLVNVKNLNPDENIFTIIVGKNGTGKSRMLGKIATDFLSNARLTTVSFANTKKTFIGGEVFFSRRPQKLIAVSTSPFDRFPLLPTDKKNDSGGYSYLGIRELLTKNYGFAYMSKIIGSLIEVIMRRGSHVREIITVLEHLGYADYIKIRMESKVSQRFITDILKYVEKDPEDIITLSRPAFMGFNRYFFLNQDGTVSKKKVGQLVKALSKLSTLPLGEIRSANLEIDGRGIHTSSLFLQHTEEFIFLVKCGLIRLRNVTLVKRGTNAPFPISDASSGEQAVIISMLGIASQIENNSIICIDEPEICLHPEWQEKYIRILTTTFRRFEGCHFIVATHSPQIVSNMVARNSYILSLETGETMDAGQYIRHSSDFQLANVFNSPGFKNEYLSRIALNIFAKVSKNKSFDEEDIAQYDILRAQSENLSKEDPVFQLYVALNEMLQAYGRH